VTVVSELEVLGLGVSKLEASELGASELELGSALVASELGASEPACSPRGNPRTSQGTESGYFVRGLHHCRSSRKPSIGRVMGYI